MWILCGISAVITAIWNVTRSLQGRDSKWFRFISLSFTIFTVCAFYDQAAAWASREDWSALMDVMPGMSLGIWILAVASVLINSISLFWNKTE